MSLAVAQRVIAAALIDAGDKHVLVSISVVDSRGDLVAMSRSDGAPWVTALVSKGKAIASAVFGMPSAELAQKSGTPAFQFLLSNDIGLIAQQGAVPIRSGGRVIGAVGVSGAASSVDEEIALAGLARAFDE